MTDVVLSTSKMNWKSSSRVISGWIKYHICFQIIKITKAQVFAQLGYIVSTNMSQKKLIDFWGEYAFKKIKKY